MPTVDRQSRQTERFLADVEEMSRSAVPGRWPSLGQVEGMDRTGTVSFAVDDGGRFAAVHLDPPWWRELGVAGLPGGLIEAQQNARDKLAAARLLFYRRLGPPAQGSRLEPFAFRHQLSDTSDMTELIRSWQVRTADSYQRIYEYERQRDAGGGLAPELLSGPEGLVQLTVAAGVITEVRVAAWQLSEHSTDRLVTDIRAALQTGRRPGCD